MTTPTTLTRRKLLAGVGTVGFLAAGTGVGLGALGGDPPYTRYTYAASPDSDDRRLRVAWYETYRDQFQEATNGSAETNATTVLDPDAPPTYVREATGPVVRLGNVLPGDYGSVIVGLAAEEVAADDDGVAVWLRASLAGNCENGVNEPESKAPGEDDPLGPGDCADEPGLGTGELADALEASVWVDDGVAGVGACDGSQGLGEDPAFEGSLAALSAGAALGDGRRLFDCLDQGARRCVGVSWSLSASAANHLQSDSVTVDLSVAGTTCDAGNPFAAGGGQ